MKPVADQLWAVVRRQEGAVTVAQAMKAGLTRSQIRTLMHNGWGHPARGVMIAPDAPDGYRASVRAAMLLYPAAVAAGITAARLHQLWGLPMWTPDELPELILPAGRTYTPRRGLRLHSGLLPKQRTTRSALPVTSLPRTVNDLASALAFDDLVCFLDSALRLGWRPQQLRLGRKRRRRVHAALALTDPRSESTFETLLRLRFVRAGLVPEALQYEVVDAAGRVYARLDIAWPSIKLAIEADGRIHHDTVPALYRDRTRANALELQGWTILRFTWADLQRRPGLVVSQVRMAMITLRATA